MPALVRSLSTNLLGIGWQLNGVPRVGLPWASLLAFLRLVTNPRVFERPEPIAEAWDQVLR